MTIALCTARATPLNPSLMQVQLRALPACPCTRPHNCRHTIHNGAPFHIGAGFAVPQCADEVCLAWARVRCAVPSVGIHLINNIQGQLSMMTASYPTSTGTTLITSPTPRPSLTMCMASCGPMTPAAICKGLLTRLATAVCCHYHQALVMLLSKASAALFQMPDQDILLLRLVAHLQAVHPCYISTVYALRCKICMSLPTAPIDLLSRLNYACAAQG